MVDMDGLLKQVMESENDGKNIRLLALALNELYNELKTIKWSIATIIILIVVNLIVLTFKGV